MKDIEKILKISEKIHQYQKVFVEKSDIKNNIFLELFLFEMLIPFEKEILKEAINILNISERGSFMLIRFLIETNFKRLIPLRKFYDMKKIEKKLKMRKMILMKR
ncbi:MAG: hypothetical protein ACRDCG_00010 [Mycoplasmoidaceae bacterium]